MIADWRLPIGFFGNTSCLIGSCCCRQSNSGLLTSFRFRDSTLECHSGFGSLTKSASAIAKDEGQSPLGNNFLEALHASSHFSAGGTLRRAAFLSF